VASLLCCLNVLQVSSSSCNVTDRFHTHIQEKEQLFVFVEHAAYLVCIRCFYPWCRPRAHKHLVSI